MKVWWNTPLKLVAIALLLHLPTISVANIEESDRSCLICHKYPGLGHVETVGRIKKQIIERVFYVNEDLFDASYHGAVPCKNCHTGVTKIPHTDVAKVDCATDCHIIEPAEGGSFSHKKIADDLQKSAHGSEGTKDKARIDDLPKCKDCHTNRTYHADVKEQGDNTAFLNVCTECHGSGNFAERFYEHITYRANKRRPSKEVVELCSKCHSDQGLVTEHNLDIVLGFQGTFHGKAIFYGDEEVANCLNCHAPYSQGFSPHRITSRTEEQSPVNENNKLETCRQSDCHIDANERVSGSYRSQWLKHRVNGSRLWCSSIPHLPVLVVPVY